MKRDARLNSSLYSDLDDYVSDSKTRFESLLGDLVEVPTVSMDPERKADIRRGGELARQYLGSIGARAELVETPGNPVVFGRLESGASDPTLTIYNHLDVQPADAADWHREPFSFFKEDGRYEG